MGANKRMDILKQETWLNLKMGEIYLRKHMNCSDVLSALKGVAMLK